MVNQLLTINPAGLWYDGGRWRKVSKRREFVAEEIRSDSSSLERTQYLFTDN